MEYRRVGLSGLQVSALALGTWATVGERLDVKKTAALFAAAYEHGINLFDTAEIYANGTCEQVMGRALRQLRWPRGSYVLSTKVMWGTGDRRPNMWGLSRKHVIEGCEDSLRRLGVEHIDLYLCHRPDPDVPLEETVRAMGDLIRQGKILYWGTSEWPAADISRSRSIALQLGVPPPVTEQPRYNLFHRRRVEIEYAPLFEGEKLGAAVWSPLAYGLLTGRYAADGSGSGRLNRRGYEWLQEEALGNGRKAARLAAVKALQTVAGEAGGTPAQLALAWCLSNPAITTVIIGASSTRQLHENFGCFKFVPLDPELRSRIEAVVAPDCRE